MAITGASRPGLAGLVGRLERLGLVARAGGRDDRRTRVTSLTTRGRRRLAALDDALAHHFVEAGPLAKEIVELLDGELGPGDATRSALDVASRLAAAGAPYADELDRIVGLTGHRQRLALSTLLTWGSARPTQLAEVLGLTSGGLTYLMDQLEADGLVERVSGTVATDRRAVVITLAPDGVAAARVMCDALERNAGPIAAALAATLNVAPAG
jgi:DNA-binding MarR family transcriptional regulator